MSSSCKPQRITGTEQRDCCEGYRCKGQSYTHTYSHILLFNELCLPFFPSSFPIPHPLDGSFLLCQPTKVLCLSLSIFSHKYSQSWALWLIVFSRLVLPPLEQSSFDINIYAQKICSSQSWVSSGLQPTRGNFQGMAHTGPQGNLQKHHGQVGGTAILRPGKPGWYVSACPWQVKCQKTPYLCVWHLGIHSIFLERPWSDLCQGKSLYIQGQS